MKNTVITPLRWLDFPSFKATPMITHIDHSSGRHCIAWLMWSWKKSSWLSRNQFCPIPNSLYFQFSFQAQWSIQLVGYTVFCFALVAFFFSKRLRAAYVLDFLSFICNEPKCVNVSPAVRSSSIFCCSLTSFHRFVNFNFFLYPYSFEFRKSYLPYLSRPTSNWMSIMLNTAACLIVDDDKGQRQTDPRFYPLWSCHCRSWRFC